MKRFVSILGLALGVTTSSFAGLVNNSGGSTSGTNLGSAGAALIDFEAGAYPLGAFSSLPFNITTSNGTFTGTLSWVNPASPGPCVTSPANSSGVTSAANATNCGGVQSFNASGIPTDKDSGNERISTYNYIDGISDRGGYGSTLRLTFTSGNVTEFSLLVRNNDSLTSGGLFNGALNYMVVNFTGGGSTSNQSLPNQGGNPANTNTFGWTVDSLGQTIASVDFVITGLDQSSSFLGTPLDIVTFDDLRIFGEGGGGTTTGGGGGTTTGGGGGEIPEPSTYALMGAGLAVLAYARRRRS